jgi:hypothetical protein
MADWTLMPLKLGWKAYLCENVSPLEPLSKLLEITPGKPFASLSKTGVARKIAVYSMLRIV